MFRVAARAVGMRMLSTSRQVDVVVVGGGIVGLATARELLVQYPKLSVALFEKVRCSRFSIL